eukprot:g63486.t1
MIPGLNESSPDSDCRTGCVDFKLVPERFKSVYYAALIYHSRLRLGSDHDGSGKRKDSDGSGKRKDSDDDLELGRPGEVVRCPGTRTGDYRIPALNQSMNEWRHHDNVMLQTARSRNLSVRLEGPFVKHFDAPQPCQPPRGNFTQTNLLGGQKEYTLIGRPLRFDNLNVIS